ncbi:hypothetical protein BGX38DRAFT_1175562 [Terfezia claveryi]|nr:hypothetical protein BGX38DRAFT_1175562 [Terfezia claveryi]
MLGWLAGGNVNKENQAPQAQTKAQQSTAQYASQDYTTGPETPAATFALKAFRSAVFGTPHPKAVSLAAPPPIEQPIPQASKPSTSKSLFGDVGGGDLTSAPNISLPTRGCREALKERPSNVDPTKAKESTKMGLGPLGDSEDDAPESLLYRTPVKRPTLSKPPVGILMTPGITNTSKKKAVSFAASTSDEVKPRPQARIRSNLPSDYPGKFPSPWTSKTIAPKGFEKDSMAVVKKSLFDISHEGDNSKALDRSSKELVTKKESDPVMRAKIAAHNEALKQTDTLSNSLKADANASSAVAATFTQNQDDDVTLNLDLPRSGSGKYWKERVEEVEAAYEKTLVKAQKWQEVCKNAKEYANKKDGECAELAERLREYIHENGRLLEDLKEAREMQGILLSRIGNIGKQEEKRSSIGATGATARDVGDLRATIEAYEKKMAAMEELIQQREEEMAKMTMYLEQSPDAPADSVVRDLQKQLRKARLELREMTLVKVDNESKNLRLITLDKELSTYKSESARLEAELREARGGVGDITHIASRNRSLHENRLRLQVERLEQDKINLMSEIREKVSKEAQDRREIEKTYKNQIRDLDSRLDAARLAAEKREMEHDDLLRRMGELDRQLTRKNRELDDALKQGEELRKNVAALAPSPGGCAAAEGVMWQAKQRGLLSEVRAAKEEAAELRHKLDEKERECQGVREEVVRLRFRLQGMDVSRPGSPVKADKDRDVEMYSPVQQASTSPPLRTRVSRASLAASPAKSGHFSDLSSPSLQLQFDAARSTSPNRFLTRRSATSFSTALNKDKEATAPAKDPIKTNLFGTSVPTFSVPASTSEPRSVLDGNSQANLDDIFNATVVPSSPLEIPAKQKQTFATTGDLITPHKNTNIFLGRPSPRPHIIPVSFSSSPPEPAHAKIHPRRVTKRASLGNESSMISSSSRRVSAGASRRISLPSGGLRDVSGSVAHATAGTGAGAMDAARREAAKARLAEKRKVRLAGRVSTGDV